MADITRKANLDPNVISYTKLSCYLRCPFMFYEEYILEKEIMPNKAMLFGIKVHERAALIEPVMDPEDIRDIMKGFVDIHKDCAMHYGEYLSDKFNAEKPEYEAIIPVNENLSLEMHVDRILFDSYGNLYLFDLKTSKNIMSKIQIAFDMQLNIYAWAYLKILANKRDEMVKCLSQDKLDVHEAYITKAKLDILAGKNKVFIGHFPWFFGHPVYTELDRSQDYTDVVIEIHKDMVKDGKQFFPRCVNEYCARCSKMNECVPDLVPDTYAGIKHKISLLEEQLSVKKAYLIAAAQEFDTDILVATEPEKGYYFLKSRSSPLYNEDALYDIMKSNPEKMRKFFSVTSEALKEAGIDGEPYKIGVKSIATWFEFKAALPKTKKK